MIVLNETPKIVLFAFVCNKGNQYFLSAHLSDGVYNIHINSNLIKTGIWHIPPDYQAAKELLEIHLNK